MKTTNQLSIILAILLLSFSISSCKENLKPIGHIVEGNKHIITLNVDTKNINNENLCKTTNFGQTDGSLNEDFTITVKLGDSIVWQGVSTWSKGDVVEINKIEHEKGINIFKTKFLNARKGKVAGEVKLLTKKDSIYKYKIFFTVIHDGKKKNETFFIDPKIDVIK